MSGAGASSGDPTLAGGRRPGGRNGMKVAVIGLGAMGRPIARHVRAAGHDVVGHDVDSGSRRRAEADGIAVADDLAAAGRAEVCLVVVATDAQSEAATRGILERGAAGGAIVIVATNSPRTMQRLAGEAAAAGFDFG